MSLLSIKFFVFCETNNNHCKVKICDRERISAVLPYRCPIIKYYTVDLLSLLSRKMVFSRDIQEYRFSGQQQKQICTREAESRKSTFFNIIIGTDLEIQIYENYKLKNFDRYRNVSFIIIRQTECKKEQY
jgi:hypothetical protein